ncbi:hypothetical protein HYY75_02615 [bacterium]|nr:hypothetical protein [bacterium]
MLVIFCLLAVTIYFFFLVDSSQEETTHAAPLPPTLYSSSRFLFGTGNRLGTYYPVGKIIVEWLNDNLEAFLGEKDYLNRNFPELRAIWPLWPDVVHFLISQNNIGVEFQNLIRKKGFLGQSKSSTLRTGREILSFYGLDSQDIEVSLDPNFVVESLKSGEISFALIQAGIPNLTVSDMLVFNGCGILGLPRDDIASLCTSIHAAMPVNISNGYYREDIPAIGSIGFSNLLLCRDDLPKEVVEKIIDLTLQGYGYLKVKHAAVSAIPADANAALQILIRQGIPVHEGVNEFIKRQGNKN